MENTYFYIGNRLVAVIVGRHTENQHRRTVDDIVRFSKVQESEIKKFVL